VCTSIVGKQGEAIEGANVPLTTLDINVKDNDFGTFFGEQPSDSFAKTLKAWRLATCL
jgi:hypothetical protein